MEIGTNSLEIEHYVLTLKIHIPYDPAVPLLCIFPAELYTLEYQEMCTSISHDSLKLQRTLIFINSRMDK